MKRPVAPRAAHSYLLGSLAKSSIAQGRTPETTLEWAWWYGEDWLDLLLKEGQTLGHGVVS